MSATPNPTTRAKNVSPNLISFLPFDCPRPFSSFLPLTIIYPHFFFLMSTTNTQRRRSHQPTAPARAAPTQRDSRSRSRVGRAGPRNNHAEPRGRQQDRERSASPRRRAVTAPRSPPRRTPSPQARPGGNPDDPGGGEDSSCVSSHLALIHLCFLLIFSQW